MATEINIDVAVEKGSKPCDHNCVAAPPPTSSSAETYIHTHIRMYIYYDMSNNSSDDHPSVVSNLFKALMRLNNVTHLSDDAHLS